MKVSLMPQSIGVKNIKSNDLQQNPAVLNTTKPDSVSFTGNKVQTVESLLNLLKSEAKIVFGDFTHVNCADEMKIHLRDDSADYFFKKLNVSTYLGFGPSKTKYELSKISNLKNVKSTSQTLTKEDFDYLTSQARETALKKTLAECKLSVIPNMTEFLKSSCLWLKDGSLKYDMAHNYVMGEHQITAQCFKQTDYGFEVKFIKSTMKDGFKQGVDINNNFFALKDPKEIEKFNQVLAVKDALDVQKKFEPKQCWTKIYLMQFNKLSD